MSKQSSEEWGDAGEEEGSAFCTALLSVSCAGTSGPLQPHQPAVRTPTGAWGEKNCDRTRVTQLATSGSDERAGKLAERQRRVTRRVGAEGGVSVGALQCQPRQGVWPESAVTRLLQQRWIAGVGGAELLHHTHQNKWTCSE